MGGYSSGAAGRMIVIQNFSEDSENADLKEDAVGNNVVPVLEDTTQKTAAKTKDKRRKKSDKITKAQANKWRWRW